MGGRIQIRAEILEALLQQARSEPKMECCGLLAGRAGIITAIFPAKNALASATSYEIAPQELFRLFKRLREEGLEHLGLYHSHPSGENVPSASDIAQAYYPEQAYFVLSPQPAAPRPVRAFSIRDGRTEELKIVS
ncbi:MAG TPA: M67 family metallopeptidase [Candidatus Dormibacteraeota bacterium]|nr:M67 family metallopeptidase [Candidatus Dormibacteraeota bacterium]